MMRCTTLEYYFGKRTRRHDRRVHRPEYDKQSTNVKTSSGTPFPSSQKQRCVCFRLKLPSPYRTVVSFSLDDFDPHISPCSGSWPSLAHHRTARQFQLKMNKKKNCRNIILKKNMKSKNIFIDRNNIIKTDITLS